MKIPSIPIHPILVLCLLIFPIIAQTSELKTLDAAIKMQIDRYDASREESDRNKAIEKIRQLIQQNPVQPLNSERAEFMNDYLKYAIKRKIIPLAAALIENGANPLTIQEEYNFRDQIVPFVEFPFINLDEKNAKTVTSDQQLAMAMANYLKWEIDPTNPKSIANFSERFYQLLLKHQPQLFRQVLQDPTIEAALLKNERMLKKILQFSIIYKDVESFEAILNLIHHLAPDSPIPQRSLLDAKIELPNTPYHLKTLAEAAQIAGANEIQSVLSKELEQQRTRVWAILKEAAEQVNQEERARQQAEENQRIQRERQAYIQQVQQLQQEMANLNQQVVKARQELQDALQKKIVLEQEIKPQIARKMDELNRLRQEQEEQAKQMAFKEQRIQSEKNHLLVNQEQAAAQKQAQDMALKKLSEEHAKLKIEMDQLKVAQAAMTKEKADMEQAVAQQKIEETRIRAEKEANIEQMNQLQQEMANLKQQILNARQELQDTLQNKILFEQERGPLIARKMEELNKLRQEQEEQAKRIALKEQRIESARNHLLADQEQVVAQQQEQAMAMQRLSDEHAKLKMEWEKLAADQAALAAQKAEVENKKLLVEGLQKVLIDRNILNPGVAPLCADAGQATQTLEGIYRLINKSPTELEQALLGQMSECVDFVTFLNNLNPTAPPKNDHSEDVGAHYGKCVAKFPTLAGMFKPQCGDVVGGLAAADGRSDLHERAAYVVDRMTNLNLVPPTVQITTSIRDRQNRYRNRNVSGSLQLWFDNTVAAKNLRRYDMSLRLQLFDYLNGNCDRHKGNILLSKTIPSQEIAIDNGMAFNSGYCDHRSQKRTSLEDQLERSLQGLSTSELSSITNEIKKLLNGFDPNSPSFQAVLCDELKYGLLSDRERTEFNQRLHYLHYRAYNSQPRSPYCTEQIDPIRPRNQFRPKDCSDKNIIR